MGVCVLHYIDKCFVSIGKRTFFQIIALTWLLVCFCFFILGVRCVQKVSLQLRHQEPRQLLKVRVKSFHYSHWCSVSADVYVYHLTHTAPYCLLLSSFILSFISLSQQLITNIRVKCGGGFFIIDCSCITQCASLRLT